MADSYLQRKGRIVGGSKSKLSGLLAGLMALVLMLVILPVVASADNSTDALNALRSQGWYISQANEKSVGDLSKAKDTLTNAVKTLNDRKHTTVIALLDSATLPNSSSCKGGKISDCANVTRDSLKDKGIQIAVVVDIPQRKFALSVDSNLLNETVTDSLTASSAITALFRNGQYAEGAAQLATNAADQIDTNAKAANDSKNAIVSQTKKEESGNLFVAMIVVLVVVLAIGGAAAFLVVTTKKVWNGKVEELQKSATAVNDMVLRLSDEVEYLEPNVQASAKATFAQGAMQVNAANEAARQIKAASTISLIFKWGQFNTQYQEALAKMESVQETLNRVDQTVKRDIGGSLPQTNNVPQQLGEYEQNSR